MECDNNILSKMLEELVRQVAAEVRGVEAIQLAEIAKALNEIKNELKMLANSRVSTTETSDKPNLIFGFWNRNDVVFMSDRRLWDRETYPDAPFKSRHAIQRASKANPTLFFKNGQRYNTALAGDLYDFICNKEARDILNGNGIKFNNKRK